MSNLVKVNPEITVGSGQSLLVIAGPCQLESLDHALLIGSTVKVLCEKLGFSYIFKGSFDKANRTSLGGIRGLGIQEGLTILSKIRDRLSVPVLTDVHSVEQAEVAGNTVDVLQTPAFLCRQTDLLIAAGKSGKVVNIKKGQFLAPQDMQYAAEKVASTGNKSILFCERGTTFGYRDLVVDMRSLPIMQSLGHPVIFDATHSIQQPGAALGESGGSREFVPTLSRAAVAAGIDGIFLECHQDPANAPSDGASMLHLDNLEPLLASLKRVRDALHIV